MKKKNDVEKEITNKLETQHKDKSNIFKVDQIEKDEKNDKKNKQIITEQN